MGFRLTGPVGTVLPFATALPDVFIQRVKARFKTIEGIERRRSARAFVARSRHAGAAGLPRRGIDLTRKAVDGAAQFFLARIVMISAVRPAPGQVTIFIKSRIQQIVVSRVRYIIVEIVGGAF
jgi:hypothetical protein